MCNCGNVDMGSYENTIMLPFPPHMEQYKNNRIKAGLSGKGICIDKCIVEEIQYLWSLGIVTYGSCCGHNQAEPMVNIDKKDIDLMVSLGYKQNHIDKTRKDTFKLNPKEGYKMNTKKDYIKTIRDNSGELCEVFGELPPDTLLKCIKDVNGVGDVGMSGLTFGYSAFEEGKVYPVRYQTDWGGVLVSYVLDSDGTLWMAETKFFEINNPKEGV